MRRKGNLGVDDHKTSVVGVACGQELKKERRRLFGSLGSLVAD
jgi:hypothetical protein